MSDDDLAAEAGHMWRYLSATYSDHPVTEYVCELCLEHLLVGPGEVHPEEC